MVRLKWSLKELYVDGNPRIDDESVGPILLLTRLRYLSVINTSVGMLGLRRLAADVFDNPRQFEIEAPEPCHEYIASENSCQLYG